MSDILFDGLPDKIKSDFELLYAGIQQADVGISLYDSTLHLVMCNASFRGIFGFPAAMTVPGAPLAPMLRFLAEQRAYGDVDVESFVAAAIKELHEMTQPLTRERRVSDGRIFLSHTSRLEAGGYITVHTDISYYKEAEAALLEMVGELEACMDSAALGICSVVRESALRFAVRRVSPTLGSLLGYGRGELVGSDLRQLFASEEEGAEVVESFGQCALRGERYSGRHALRGKDGRRVVGELKGVPRGAGQSVWLFEAVAGTDKAKEVLA